MSIPPRAAARSTHSDLLDDVFSRLHALSTSPSTLYSTPAAPTLSEMAFRNNLPQVVAAQSPSTHFAFDPSLGLSSPFFSKHRADDVSSVTPVFLSRHSSLDTSPSSSASSDYDPPAGLHDGGRRGSWSLQDAFAATRSRVVKLQELSPLLQSCISAHFFPLDQICGLYPFPTPVSMWITRETHPPLAPRTDGVWAVFRSHAEACAALALSHPSILVVPALESDLEPFQKLEAIKVTSPSGVPSGLARPHLRMSSSTPDLQRRTQGGMTPLPGLMTHPRDDFVISSNPPNPRTSFRLGDWICNVPNCAAHNFGRNLSCRGCGCPRTESQIPLPQLHGNNATQSTRMPASPRFVAPSNTAQPYLYPAQSSLAPPRSAPYTNVAPPPRSPSVNHPVFNGIPKSPASSTPLLTPSGRAFSLGGKVQNVSSDPLSPCVMYWPDNEPLPEQGQIRPNGLLGVPQPPILNTGNRGPIEHQPGDWICLKCNYLNWRRRKVCQTCYPYAEGNGDSISAAVQAERIALLTSVLAQNQLPSTNSHTTTVSPENVRSHSLTPPHAPRSLSGNSAVPSQAPYRSRSQFDLGRHNSDSQFIYETSNPHSSSSFPSLRSLGEYLPDDGAAPLLPSFLQDIVQSPALSPTSTSSADLSIEEYEDSISPSARIMPRRDRLLSGSDSSSNLALSNIWRLDGDETKGLGNIALPIQMDLSVGKKGNGDMIHHQLYNP